MPAAGTIVSSVYLGTIGLQGTFGIRPLPGTATPGSHTAGVVNPHFLFQGGVVSCLPPMTGALIAFVNGTAAAAGTVACVATGAGGGMPFSLTVGASQYSGVKIDGLGGLVIRGLQQTSGTIAVTVFGRDVLQ